MNSGVVLVTNALLSGLACPARAPGRLIAAWRSWPNRAAAPTPKKLRSASMFSATE
jgi:hypothetical protein